MNDDKIVKTIRDYQSKIKSFSGLHTFMGVIAYVIFPIGLLFLIIDITSTALSYKSMYGIGIAIVVAFCICLFLLVKHIDRLQKKMKQFIGEHVVKHIIAERITIQEYKPNGSFDKDFLYSSGVLPGYSKSYGSDYIKGIYRGKEIIYCDLKLEAQQEDSDGDYKTVTVFKGPVVSLALGRSLGDKRVRILETDKTGRAISSIVNAYTNFWRAFGVKTMEQTVSLENVGFNNQFEVKTTDEELAFYILTPQFMENIISADRLAEGRTNICFGGDRVNIAIHNNHDAFEVGNTMKNTKQLEDSRARMRADLNKILSVVDEILKKDKLF
ncbi:MAG: DUF3137 domain-containing protein [Lachnospiraceae bacterium]|nr:DUF3137 domain-containing protein [Lachnospiraceae bacterium]